MRVLWICNIILPAIAQELGLPYSNREGWLTGSFERISENADSSITLGVCYPKQDEMTDAKEGVQVQGVSCYAFNENLNTPERYDKALEERFLWIIKDFAPDIVHIFGTEFPHTLAAVRAFHNPDRTLIGIQGLCCEIAPVYMAKLPRTVQKKVTFRDWLKKDSLRQQKEKFVQRGLHEQEAIRLTGHVTGRTSFDREGTGKINANATYHFMNETMRSNFYEGSWSADSCKKHTIFLGQGDYPLKGFHFLIQALPAVLKEYPDTQVKVAGNSIINYKTIKDKIKISAYGSYLRKLIKELGLQEHITILGKLSAEQMKHQFLSANVFVCPSILENSPNTVGEAMLLGMPVIASKAGGIGDMLEDGQEGILCPPADTTALSNAILRIWQDMDTQGHPLLTRLTAKAKERAHKTHNPETNFERLLAIYTQIAGV